MEKRVLIALLLSMVVLFSYPYIISRLYPPQTKEAPREAVETREAPAMQKADAGAQIKAGETKAPSVAEEVVSVDTPLYSAVFTNMGAGLKSFKLKGYKTSLEETSDLVELADRVSGLATFETRVKGNERMAFSSPVKDLAISDTGELVFTWSGADGLSVKKTYVFSARDYTIETRTDVSNGSKATVSADVSTFMVSSYGEDRDKYYHYGPIAYDRKDGVDRPDVDDEPLKGSFIEWFGLEDKYFLMAIVPEAKDGLSWSAEHLSESEAKASLTHKMTLGPGQGADFRFSAYLGPKLYDTLVSKDMGLEEAIEFGMFDFMAKPLLVVLNFFERFVKNYAVAIILLTCIIKVAFHPLTRQSLNSMKEMQKISPQVMAVRQRYKDDKEKMNKELMELYKRYKINPLAGCLPIVVQIPVFIALYEVLSVAIELRHAPFMLWIADLSAKDPLYITPILMGGTMFIQQKMTPTTMDPAQAKIMLFMPAIFTVMFLNFPSGLVLYWLVNNVITIGQQYYIHKGVK